MDEDLDQMSRERLAAEVKKLRDGIRAHRDSSDHELCWHHPALWGLLPERSDPLPTVPEWPQFMRGCIRYRQSLDDQLPDAPRSNRIPCTPRAESVISSSAGPLNSGFSSSLTLSAATGPGSSARESRP